MNKKRFILLMARQLSGVISQEEKQELEAALETSDELKNKQELLKRFWKYDSDVASKIDTARAYQQIADQLGFESTDSKVADLHFIPKRNRSNLIIKIAAAIIIILGAGLLIFWWHNNNTIIPGNNYAQLVTQKKEKKFLQLQDGTKVWLNVDSKLRYPQKFTEGKREVYLSGEAFFEVKHDASHPFVLHTANMDIEDLGTTFDVKSYPGDPTYEATLLGGSIEVTLKNKAHKKILLSPNQKLIFKNPDAESMVAEKTLLSKPLATKQKPDPITISKPTPLKALDSTVTENAWVENKLAFKDEDFKELSLQMERWYDVKITFKDKAKEAYRFSGIFTHESIKEALEALQLTDNFTFKIDGNNITIY